jgi:chemotaxis protein methyltransferase CheR
MWAPRSLALVADRIAQELGLYFPPERMDDLRRGLTGAAQDFQMADEACADWLLAAPWTEVQVRTLASHLTVGETYFFRDTPLLNAFAGHILPELLEQRRAQGRRQLRIWSAGCCTGEEPYSLAILIEQALPDLSEWDVAITATDVNPRFLEKARAGRYNEWSFRGAPTGLKPRYFQNTADGLCQIDARIQALVSFAELNMVQETYPCAINGTDAVDVIFCRNLLMYFSEQQTRKVVQQLRQSLGDGGWLIVSPSEASSTAFPGLDPVNFESAVVFRKPAAQRGDAASPWSGAAPAMQAAAIEAEPIRPVPVLAASPAVIESLASLRQTACALADQGRLGEALVWCDRWVAADKLDPWGHYIRGVVLIEQGDANGARDALQRCVYLRQGFVLAHLALGQLARGLGNEVETGRHFAVASQLLHALAPDAPLAEAGGLTAGRLRETFKVLAAAEGGP